jgi:DNA polymerase elongation subunit (family B)
MMLLDADIPYDVLVDGEWYPIRQSPLYVAGFPKPELAQQEILLLSMIDHHSGMIRLWANRAIESDNDTFALDIQNRLLKIKDTTLMTGDKPVIEYAIDVRQYDMDEPAMLKDFLTFWSSQRIDVISGWNSEGFDVPYLVNRLKNVLGDQPTSLLSPWGDVKERRYRDDNGNECQTYDIYGITHLDYLVLYKKFNPGAKESFKLDFIANLELEHGKLPMKGASFRENYLSYWNEFILYNLVDTYLLHQLEGEMLQVRLAMQVAYMAKCNFGDVVSSMRVWESFIYNHFLGLNIAEDWKKPSNKKESIVGAYVKDVVPGKYGWTYSIDATALYPSIIMQNNISPETIIGHSPIFIDDVMAGKHTEYVVDNSIISANGLLTTKDVCGFIPTLINRTFDMRNMYKKEMLNLEKRKQEIEGTPGSDLECKDLTSRIASMNIAQGAIKILNNSFYGNLALQYFRYYDPRMAEAVTATGQVFIKKTNQFVDEILSKILGTAGEYVYYMDTDSCYINCQLLVDRHCVGKSDQEIVTFIEKFVFGVIAPELNKRLSEFAKTMGVDDCRISFKLECIGPSMIMSQKKKYLFDILYYEGVRYKEPKMKVMGIDIVRSSTPGVVKDYLTDAATICLRGTESELQSHVESVKKQFMSLDYTQASFPRGCNGMSVYGATSGNTISLDGESVATVYGAKTPIQVRGALVYNHHLKKMGLDSKYPLINDGERVKFIMMNKRNPFREDVIAFPDKLPPEFDLVKYIDWNLQYKKAFVAPLEKITNALGWSMEKQPDPEFLFG